MSSHTSRLTAHRIARFGLCLLGMAAPALAQPAGTGLNDSSALFAEPACIPRVIDVAVRTLGDGSDVRDGWYPEFTSMIPGAGWISAGPGYRRWIGNDDLVVDASAAVSWRGFLNARARVEAPRLMRSRLAVGSQVLWQDLRQLPYYGSGARSARAAESLYRMRTVDVVGYATLRPRRRLAIAGALGWLGAPTILPPGGVFLPGTPYTRMVFPDSDAFAREAQPGFLHAELSVTADTRDHRSHPTRGSVVRAVWAAYAERGDGPFRFRRYEAEAATFVPFRQGRWVVAAHGWLLATRTTGDAVVPFYLEPALGGSTTLRSYPDYRFHDRHLLAVNVEARLALLAHVDAAAFVDAGSVAARLADLDLAKTSCGLGLRVHTRRSNFARIDVAHGEEGWRAMLTLGDPLHLSRLSRRTAAAPFVP